MPTEPFEIQDEKEKTLSGIIETKHPRKQQPAVIFLNGFIDTKDGRVKKKLSQLLLDDGYVTVRFDYTHGFGDGTGDPARFTLSNAVQDTTRVLDHVTRRGYVDKVVLFGYSFGGTVAILVGAFDERVKAVMTMSTPYHFLDTSITRMSDHDLSRMRLKRYFHMKTPFSEQEIRVDSTFFDNGLSRDMARATRNLRQPTLVLHGAHDERVSRSHAEEIHGRVPEPKSLEIIERMEHEPSPRQVRAVYDRVTAFLKEHL